MSKYVVVHGSIRTAEGLLDSRDNKDGELASIELTAKEAKRMDPDGTCLQLESEYVAELSAKALVSKSKKASADDAEEDEDSAEKPAKATKKKGG